MPRFGSRAVEQFGIVLLDAKHRVLRTAVLARRRAEQLASSQPRDVFREAAIGGAAAIVVFHNHPSGDPTPSPDDVDLTRRLVAAGVLMGIDVVDHLVLGDARYCSFKETGRRCEPGALLRLLLGDLGRHGARRDARCRPAARRPEARARQPGARRRARARRRVSCAPASRRPSSRSTSTQHDRTAHDHHHAARSRPRHDHADDHGTRAATPIAACPRSSR